MMLTDLADVLRGAGLTVKEMPGWKTRGVNGWSVNGPFGGLVHHTGTVATAAGDYPSLKVVRSGRSDLQGPLAQLGLGRSGTWYVIAAGYCNHAGPVDDPDYSNARAIGIECENPGGSTPWPTVQYASLITGCSALGRHYGIRWRGHKEAAIPKGRKVDPNLDMVKLRSKIAAYRRPAPTQEDDDMKADDKIDLSDAYYPTLNPPRPAARKDVPYVKAFADLFNYTSTAVRDGKLALDQLVTISKQLDELPAKIAAAIAAGSKVTR